MIRLLIADDHAVVRSGLEHLVATFDDVELVGAAADGEEAVRLCAERRADVVLMDLEMPVLDGIEATRRIVAESPGRRSSSSRRSPTASRSSARSMPVAATSSRTPSRTSWRAQSAPPRGARRRSIRAQAGPCPRAHGRLAAGRALRARARGARDGRARAFPTS